MSVTDTNAPKVIALRNGKKARLSEPPHWNGWNQAYFVFYEHDSYRFSLHWPCLRFHGEGGEDHPLDAIEVQE